MTASGVNNEMLQAVKTEIERQSQHEIPDPGHGLTWLEGYFNLKEILEAALVVKGVSLPDWEYVAKAFFKTEKHLTADQAWFDFQAKAQRFLEVLKAEMPPQPIPTPDEAGVTIETEIFPLRMGAGLKADIKVRPVHSGYCPEFIFHGGTEASPGSTNADDFHYVLTAMSRVAALSRGRPEEATQVSDYVESLKEQYGKANDALREFAKATGAPLGCSLSDWLRKYTAALKFKSAHSLAPTRVDEATMREIYRQIRTKMDSEAAWLRGDSACEEEVVLAFGRTLMEKKP